MKLSALFLVLALSGCATLQNEIKPWMGRSKTELMGSWGPPMSTQSDGQGGTILFYSRVAGYSSAQIWMYARQDGTLYFWRTRER